jgi:hypothetical protein
MTDDVLLARLLFTHGLMQVAGRVGGSHEHYIG